MNTKGLSTEMLIFLIFLSVMIVFSVALGVLFWQSSESAADQSCLAAVATRATGLRIADSAERISLDACKTRVRQFGAGASDRVVRNQMAEDLSWCIRSFRPAGDAYIASGTMRFCHVCAIFYDERGREIDGVWERAQLLGGIGHLRDSLTEDQKEVLGIQDELEVEVSFALDTPLVVLYVQDRVENYESFFQQMLYRRASVGTTASVFAVVGGVAGFVLGPPGWLATLTVAGGALIGTVAGVPTGFIIGLMDGPELQGFSGTVILPYNETFFSDIGCTRID